MARIRKANKNSNMMIVRANEESPAIEVTFTAGAGNDDWTSAWISETEDGDAFNSGMSGTTMYLIVEEGLVGTATVTDEDSNTVATQTATGSKSFVVPASNLTVSYESGK